MVSPGLPLSGCTCAPACKAPAPAGLVLGGGLCASAQAVTYLVTALADSVPGSLREAVAHASQNPGHDTIRFALHRTIELASASKGGAVMAPGRLVVVSESLFANIVAPMGSGNLSSDHSCPFDAAHGSASGPNPMLGSLADHGGSTRTYLPQPGRPAVDAGIDTPAPGPTGNSVSTDQRGLRRNVGLRVGRGAVELQVSDRLAARPEPVAERTQPVPGINSGTHLLLPTDAAHATARR